MVFHKVLPRLGCWLLVGAFPATCVALQTGPPTLENLLNPTTEDLENEAPTPFDKPAKPDARPEDNRSEEKQPQPAPPGPPAKRLAVPEQSAVDEALELINQAYEETITSAGANPEAAIRTFRDTADKTTDPARKFALLVLAERLALEARSTTAALDIIARRAAIFDVDALASRHALLSRVARAEDVRPDALLFEHVIETARRAVAADRFDLADAAADLSESIAKAIEKDEKVRMAESRRKREPPPTLVAAKLQAEATTLQKAVRERRRQAFEYTTARDKLAAFPDDAEAAEIVGRYLCFVKRDWPAGLAMLARGRNESLRNLAAREIALAKEPQVAATDRLKLANEWWKLSETADAFPAEQAEALQAHASGIYRDIAGKLTDPIDAALARKRSKTTNAEVAPSADAVPVQAKPALPTLDSVFQGDDR
jgi:hypothetical protein